MAYYTSGRVGVGVGMGIGKVWSSAGTDRVATSGEISSV